ncbi:MAG: FAD-binding oxidoreductase [Desulfomonilaceae bacterium]|nr:FAD-binding oxidoreductase [Desulfomonilaceae bacterium]
MPQEARKVSSMQDFLRELRDLHMPVMERDFENYLKDESRFTGHASAVVRVRNARDVIAVVRPANRWSIPLTVVSGKTSVTGGPVPLGGVVLDVRGLDSIDPEDPTRVGPGVILSEYKQWVEARGLCYPVDPTSEDSCTLGGNVACNASGASSFLYGPTRTYIQGLTVVLPTGTRLSIDRGDVVSRDGIFHVPGVLLAPKQEDELVIPVPRTGVPPWHVCKNSAGLFSEDPMDLVDLFIGSEGILGIITGIRTRLLPRRNPRFSIIFYPPDLDTTVLMVQILHRFKRFFHDGEVALAGDIDEALVGLTSRPQENWQDRFSGLVPTCIEWLGSSTAPILSADRSRKLGNSYGALCVEQEYPQGSDPTDTASQWNDLLEEINGFMGDGRRTVVSEVAVDEKHIRQIKEERHRIPEKMNESVKPGMVKIATDFAVPMSRLKDLLSLYDAELPNGKSYVFGHIGNAHVHANMIPENDDEAREFRSIYLNMARKVCRLGGSVAGEHGIGKLKREVLAMMIGSEGIEEIRKVKRVLDPKGLLNLQNMVSWV